MNTHRDELVQLRVENADLKDQVWILEDQVSILTQNIQESDKHIEKLAKRIHNQRVALRNNWQIVREQIRHRPTQLRSMWFDKVITLGKEKKQLQNNNQLLKRELQDLYAELDSLELAAIPGLVDRVQCRYKRLVNAGLIKPEEE